MQLGLIGLGKMGLSHLAIVRAHPGVNLVAACDSTAYLTDVADGVSYDVRVRFENGLGVRSAWTDRRSEVERAGGTARHRARRARG